MENYEPAMSFGEDIAEDYDNLARRGDEVATVAFLERLARGGPALELAIGTGRIALPLAARGIRVDGIDFSPAMVAKLRARPEGDQISVTMGNFADVAVPGTYRLIYVVFNTLFNLLTQDEQVRCFENVTTHLTNDGSFVVEGAVPADLFRLRNHQYVEAETIGVNSVRLDVARHDPVKQLLEETHVTLSSRGVHLNPIVTRYAWPAELDLMARIAGLHLKERWAGWNREPFTSTSSNCVSVYGH
jgi:SAM-dependent methyltransferase